MALKISLVGCGNWGRNLIRNLNNLGVLYSAHDLIDDNLNAFKDLPEYKDVKFSNDWNDTLDEVDAVVIATPPASHYSLAMEAMKKGKHIFVEKPLTVRPKEAEMLSNYAREHKLVLMVGHIFLYSPEIIALKKVVKSKEFGAIKYIQTQRLSLGKYQSSDVVWDLMPHDVSVTSYLLEDYCRKISANGFNIMSDVEDTAFANLIYGNDVVCHFHLSWLYPKKVRDTVVIGENQMAICDSVTKTLTVYDSKVDIPMNDEGHFLFDLTKYTQGVSKEIPVPMYESLYAELDEFCNCIKEDRVPLSDGYLATEVVNVLDAAQESLTLKGEWVTV